MEADKTSVRYQTMYTLKSLVEPLINYDSFLSSTSTNNNFSSFIDGIRHVDFPKHPLSSMEFTQFVG